MGSVGVRVRVCSGVYSHTGAETSDLRVGGHVAFVDRL